MALLSSTIGAKNSGAKQEIINLGISTLVCQLLKSNGVGAPKIPIYRNIKNVGKLHDLAAFLDTPSNWDDSYNRVCKSDYVIRLLNCFRSLPFFGIKNTEEYKY